MDTNSSHYCCSHLLYRAHCEKKDNMTAKHANNFAHLERDASSCLQCRWKESWQGSEGNWFIHCMWVCKNAQGWMNWFHINGLFLYNRKWTWKRKLRFFFAQHSAMKGKNWGREKSCKWFITSFQTLVLQLIYLLPLLSCHCCYLLTISLSFLSFFPFFLLLQESTLYTIVWR